MTTQLSNNFSKTKENHLLTNKNNTFIATPIRVAFLSLAALAVYFTFQPKTEYQEESNTTHQFSRSFITAGLLARIGGIGIFIHAKTRNRKKNPLESNFAAANPSFMESAHMRNGYRSGNSTSPLNQAKIILLGDIHSQKYLGDLRAEIFNQLSKSNSVILIESAAS